MKQRILPVAEPRRKFPPRSPRPAFPLARPIHWVGYLRHKAARLFHFFGNADVARCGVKRTDFHTTATCLDFDVCRICRRGLFQDMQNATTTTPPLHITPGMRQILKNLYVGASWTRGLRGAPWVSKRADRELEALVRRGYVQRVKGINQLKAGAFILTDAGQRLLYKESGGKLCAMAGGAP